MSFVSHRDLTSGFITGLLGRRRPSAAASVSADSRMRQFGGSREVGSGPLLRARGAATRMVLTHVSLSVVSGVLIESAATAAPAGRSAAGPS